MRYATLALISLAGFAAAAQAGTLSVSRDGQLRSVGFPDGATRELSAGTEIEGFHTTGAAQVLTTPSGVVVVRTWEDGKGGACEVRDTLAPSAYGIRWDIEVTGRGPDGTAPIATRVAYPVREHPARLWAAWGDPLQRTDDRLPPDGGPWTNPLQARPLADSRLFYGALPFTLDDPLLGFVPMRGNLISLPLASLLEEKEDRGLSVVLSPEDALLDVTLDTQTGGTLVFRRLNERISRSRPLHFSVDLVMHEADWRGGLRFLCSRYPGFMNPPNPAADAMAGTGGYSPDETPFDASALHRMAFRVNWKASFDFPYMGMFLPPVAEETDTWNRFGGGTTSLKAMERYAARMHAAGFQVLSYLNVTEFGAHVTWPPGPPDPAASWKDGQAYLFGPLRGAVIHMPPVAADAVPRFAGSKPGTPYYTWEGGIAVDCADPAYHAFLLGQVRRHLEWLPAASGFCIDRMDWIRIYNTEADDGQSWFDGRPARSLLSSWKALMAELGPLVHGSGKVIFVNNHDKRLDALGQVDGIYDEFGYDGRSLNLTAFLCVRKPAIAWTSEPKDLQPDPDAFFQRHLLMGVYPTAPVPGNDHAIGPDPWATGQYEAYGPLLDAIRGKKWDLSPHAAEAQGSALVNLFEVPGGYAVPVTFAGNAATAVVDLRVPMPASAQALLPGQRQAQKVAVVATASGVRITTPIERGCALVVLRVSTP